MRRRRPSPQWFDSPSVQKVEELLYSYRDYFSDIERSPSGLVALWSEVPPSLKAYSPHDSSGPERTITKLMSLPDHIQTIYREKNSLGKLHRAVLIRRYFMLQEDRQIMKDLKLTHPQVLEIRHNIVQFFASAFGMSLPR